MRVAIVTSVSANIAELASLTVPNKLEYCLRHGYTLMVHNQPYAEVVGSMDRIVPLLDMFDMLWLLDADAVITDMTQPIESLSCLGPHMTVCEEGIVEWNRLNCGSVVVRSTDCSRQNLRTKANTRSVWEHMPCIWQTWLGENVEQLAGAVTVAPLRAFNSCVWNRPANAYDEIGGHWQPGDLVYHTCGVFPASERIAWLRDAISTKVQR